MEKHTYNVLSGFNDLETIEYNPRLCIDIRQENSWKFDESCEILESKRIKNIVRELNRYEIIYKHFYGIGGLRDEINVISTMSSQIIFSIGLVFPSLSQIGIMLTASHNSAEYIGIKIMKKDSPYMSQIERYIFNRLINVNKNIFHDLQEKYSRDIIKKNIKLYVGCDTRTSCGHILSAIELMKHLFSQVRYVGRVTTPHLYHILQEPRDKDYMYDSQKLMTSTSDLVRHNSYVYNLCKTIDILDLTETIFDRYRLVIDCSNSVCAFSINMISTEYKIRVINFRTDQDILLNNNCGADHILHCYQLLENVYPKESLIASLDGDGDRMVMVYWNNVPDSKKKSTKKNNLSLLFDGTKICALFLHYLIRLSNKNHLAFSNMHIGIVHSPYTNGAFIDYVNRLQESNMHLNLNLICTTPGIERLESVAKTYDIGICFESNGHGEVIIKTDNHLLKPLKMLYSGGYEDGIVNIFAVIYILYTLNMSIFDWNCLYSENPFLLTKVKVVHRNKIMYNNLSDEIIYPKSLVDLISKLKKEHPGLRLYIRSSTTEKLVRVYLEMKNIVKEIDNLLKNIAEQIKTELITIDTMQIE